MVCTIGMHFCVNVTEVHMAAGVDSDMPLYRVQQVCKAQLVHSMMAADCLQPATTKRLTKSMVSKVLHSPHTAPLKLGLLRCGSAHLDALPC